MASRLHQLCRRHRKPLQTPPLLVVGSIRSGGTAKTDLVAWIAREHPDLAILAHPTGDEDRWLEKRFPGRVFVARDFLKAWGKARAAGFQRAVCDGGLQDPALEDCPAVNLELEGPRPQLGDLFPFGRFRERKPRPRRALHTVKIPSDLGFALDPATLPRSGTNVVAACAIARPEVFFQDLRNMGLTLVETISFGDHLRFDPSTLARIASKHSEATWVITEKDQARGESRLLPQAFVARRNLSPTDDLVQFVETTLSGHSMNKMLVTPRG